MQTWYILTKESWMTHHFEFDFLFLSAMQLKYYNSTCIICDIIKGQELMTVILTHPFIQLVP